MTPSCFILLRKLSTALFYVLETLDNRSVLVIFFSASMLIATSLVVRQRQLFPEISPVFSFIGFFLYFAVLFVLSFFNRGRIFLSIHFGQFMQSLFFFSFALAAIAMWAWAIWPTPKIKSQSHRALSAEYYGVMAALCIMILNTLYMAPLSGWPGMVVFNLLFLYQCVFMIIAGC